MRVQVLTFHTGNSFIAADHAEYVHLAVAEFAGLVSEVSFAREDGDMVAVFAWEDDQCLRLFQHSEAYARLMLDPHLEQADDHSFEAQPRVVSPQSIIDDWFAVAA